MTNVSIATNTVTGKHDSKFSFSDGVAVSERIESSLIFSCIAGRFGVDVNQVEGHEFRHGIRLWSQSGRGHSWL